MIDRQGSSQKCVDGTTYSLLNSIELFCVGGEKLNNRGDRTLNAENIEVPYIAPRRRVWFSSAPPEKFFLSEMVRFGALLMGSTDTYVAMN